MKNILILTILIFSIHVFGEDCTEKNALAIGIEEIKKNFHDYKKYLPYKVISSNGSWIVYGTLPEGWLGGTPEVIIDKETCKVIKVQHGR